MKSLAYGMGAALLVTTSVLGAVVPAAAQDKANISMWFDVTGGGESAECMKTNLVEPFNAQSTTTTVEATMQANGWQATRTALAGGGGPDIVNTPGPSWAVELAKAGQLRPLDDFADQFGWRERFVPWSLNLGTVDGALYSLPVEQETMILYYNKTLFDAKGWAPPKTMDELTALSEKVAADGVIPFAHGNQEWRPANHWYLGEFLNQIAGPQKVYDFLTGAAKLTDPEFVKAVDTLNEYQKNGWFMGGLENYYTTTTDEEHVALGDGQAAMLMEGTWFFSDVANYFGEAAGNTNDWGWVPIPSATGEPTFDLGIGSTYSINPASQHPESAAEFLDYMFQPETQARLVVECGVAPAPIKFGEGALQNVETRQADTIEQLNAAAAAGNYGYLMWTFFPPKVDSYMTENIERVWAGELTTEEFLTEAQAIYDEEAAAGNLLPVPDRGN